jgi:hypothetical protein
MRKVIMIDGSTVWLLDDLRIKSSWPEMTSSDARTELALIANHDPDCGADKSHIAAREYLQGHSAAECHVTRVKCPGQNVGRAFLPAAAILGGFFGQRRRPTSER